MDSSQSIYDMARQLDPFGTRKGTIWFTYEYLWPFGPLNSIVELAWRHKLVVRRQEHGIFNRKGKLELSGIEKDLYWFFASIPPEILE
jgi:hypothetical protein